jgi:hypothetical protein
MTTQSVSSGQVALIPQRNGTRIPTVQSVKNVQLNLSSAQITNICAAECNANLWRLLVLVTTSTFPKTNAKIAIHISFQVRLINLSVLKLRSASIQETLWMSAECAAPAQSIHILMPTKLLVFLMTLAMLRVNQQLLG